jgi:hypothetical protein
VSDTNAAIQTWTGVASLAVSIVALVQARSHRPRDAGTGPLASQEATADRTGEGAGHRTAGPRQATAGPSQASGRRPRQPAIPAPTVPAEPQRTGSSRQWLWAVVGFVVALSAGILFSEISAPYRRFMHSPLFSIVFPAIAAAIWLYAGLRARRDSRPRALTYLVAGVFSAWVALSSGVLALPISETYQGLILLAMLGVGIWWAWAAVFNPWELPRWLGGGERPK